MVYVMSWQQSSSLQSLAQESESKSPDRFIFAMQLWKMPAIHEVHPGETIPHALLPLR
jgi:hypothetical protein